MYVAYLNAKSTIVPRCDKEQRTGVISHSWVLAPIPLHR